MLELNASTGGLLVPEGIIRPVASDASLTWLIRYIFYWNLQFLNHEIIIKAMVFFPQASVPLAVFFVFLAILFRPFGFLAPKDCKLIWLWTYVMKVIAETTSILIPLGQWQNKMCQLYEKAFNVKVGKTVKEKIGLFYCKQFYLKITIFWNVGHAMIY